MTCYVKEKFYNCDKIISLSFLQHTKIKKSNSKKKCRQQSTQRSVKEGICQILKGVWMIQG